MPPAWFAALALLVSILAHEGGHALLARRNGLPGDSVTLWLLGGATTLRGEADSPGAEARIALAGPLVSAGVAAGAGGSAVLADAAGAPGLVVVLLRWLAWVNGLLAGFNLLPAAPLDGGRLLRAALWARWADRSRATVAAATAGRAGGQLVSAAGLAVIVLGGNMVTGIWLVVLGWFLDQAAMSERRRAMTRRRLGGLTVGEVMRTDVERVQGWLNLRDFVQDHVRAGSAGTYLVQRPDGHLTGVLTLRQVLEVPEDVRPTIAVRLLARPVSEALHVRPGQSLLDALEQLDLIEGDAALVFDADDVVGVLDADAMTTWAARRPPPDVPGGWPLPSPTPR